MSYTKSKGEERERENKRMSQLIERARNDPVVHKQLIDIMEEDPELIRAFSKQAEAIYGAKWKTMSPSDKSKLIKSAMEKNRIPTPTKRGGRKTKKAKKMKKNASKKAKKLKTKRRTMRKKTSRR